MKKLFTAAIALMSLLPMNAQDVIQFLPKSTNAGVVEDDEECLSLQMVNTVTPTLLQLTIAVPEGMTLITDYVDLNPDRFDGTTRRGVFTPFHTIDFSRNDDGTYLLMIYDNDLGVVKGAEGEIAQIYFETSEDMAPGYYPIVISDIIIAVDENPDNGKKIASSTSYVKVGEPEAFNVPLSGYVAPFVTEALPTSGTLDLTNVTGIGGELKLSDNVDLVPPTTEITVEKVSYTRAAANTYGTICLPYELTSDPTVQYYTLGQIADGNLTLVEAATVPAGTPAIWEKKSGSEVSAVATNATIPVVGTHESAGTGIKLVGCYQNTNVTTPGTYYIKDNKFYRINGNFNCGAYRAYIATEQSEAKVLNIVNDDASAINTLNALTSGSYEAIYSEGGAKQDALQKGVNIIKMQDGSVKKVMVK